MNPTPPIANVFKKKKIENTMENAQTNDNLTSGEENKSKYQILVLLCVFFFSFLFCCFFTTFCLYVFLCAQKDRFLVEKIIIITKKKKYNNNIFLYSNYFSTYLRFSWVWSFSMVFVNIIEKKKPRGVVGSTHIFF